MPQCLYTRIIHDAPVACGKCMNCRNKRISGWAARLMKEDMHSSMSFFVTFTYDPAHVMFCEKGRPTLWPSHLTNYWKLLRKKNVKFKYYACGEYGSNRKRPHYHAILFIKETTLSPTQVINLIDSTWVHGETFSGTVTAESIAYTLKYISKKGSVPEYAGDKRHAEFQRSSKGLGLDYLQKIGHWHLDDLLNRAYIPLQGGGKAPIPRYYKDRIYTLEQRLLIGQHMEETQYRPDYHNIVELRKKSFEKINK